MTTIIVSSAWAQGGQTRFEAGAGLLHDVLKDFAAANPDYRRRLLGKDGEPFTYFNIYLDDDLVPRRQLAEARVEPGSVITIVPPLAGG